MFNPDDYGMQPEIQAFFLPSTKQTNQKKKSEAAIKIPAEKGLLTAGESNLATDIFICDLLENAICFLHLNIHTFNRLDQLFFVVVGAAASLEKVKCVPGGRVHLVFPNDLLGHVSDLKVASWLRRQPVRVSLEGNNKLNVYFRSNHYYIDQKLFTLNYFEKKSGYPFKVRTHKPKTYNTFFEQLQHGNQP